MKTAAQVTAQALKRLARLGYTHPCRPHPVATAMKNTVLLLVAALLVAAAPARAGSDCNEAGLQDPFLCLSILVEYDAATFDRVAFNNAYGTTIATDIPQLAVLEAVAPDTLTRDRIRSEGFPGKTGTELNSKLLNPECRQISLGFPETGHLPQDVAAQAAVTLLRVPPAWAYSQGTGVTVAVADSGIDASHPAVAAQNLAGGWDYVDGDALADDAGLDTDPAKGHGTAVASLIAAVAPGVRILAYRIADPLCDTNAMRVAAAIVAAADAGAQVFNLSVGMLDQHTYVKQALQYAGNHGMLVIAAAGNSAAAPSEYPARDSAVLSVSAVDDGGVKASYASYDSGVDLVAPGNDILGAYPQNRYIRASGTSFATALVSGIAALAFSAQTCAGSKEIAELLAATAEPVDLVPGNEPWNGQLGSGLANAGAAAVPGASLTPIVALKATKLADGILRFTWTPEDGGYHLNSVATRAEIAAASDNAAACPSCPAASLVRRCDLAQALPAGCDDSSSRFDTAPVLYYQAFSACVGVEGPF